MTKNPPAVLRSTLYALRGGFLIRPFVIAFLLGTAGAVLSAIEERYPAIQAIVPWTLFPSHADPQVAQAILTTIATATMTVVSIVFAILLVWTGGVLQEENLETAALGLAPMYLPSWRSSNFGMPPWLAGSEYGVERNDKLTHYGGDDQFAWLAVLLESFGEEPHDGIVLDGG